jgi:flagellar biosynthesis protein FlhB
VSERRHPPSQRRLDEARRRGEVAVSPGLVGAAALVAAVAALLATARGSGERLISLSRRGFAGQGEPLALIDEAWRALAWTAGPVLGAALAAALAAGFAQTRGLFAVAPLLPAAPRRRPADGALRALAFGAVAAAAAAIAVRMEGEAAARALAPGLSGLGGALEALGRVALRVGAALIAAGLVDWLVRHARWRRSLWMTRAEAEAEQREEEGDPRLAAERRRRHQALSGSRLADDVRAAEVVVSAEGTAAGLRRDGDRLLVAAAGERLVAARILDLARRFGVPVRLDVDLAPGMAALTPGDPVPSRFESRAWAVIRSEA